MVMEWPKEVAKVTMGNLPDCEIDRGSCSKRMGDKTVVLDVSPKPVRAMEELALEITILSVQPPRHNDGQEEFGWLTLDLVMPGMFMGRNRVILRKTSEGRYIGRGVIPRCPSGKSLWKITVNVPNLGSIDFFFDVSH